MRTQGYVNIDGETILYQNISGNQTSGAGIQSFAGAPFPAGTYSNLVVNFWYPALTLSTNAVFTVFVNGANTFTNISIVGPVSGNASHTVSSGTNLLVLSSESLLNFGAESSSNTISGSYFGWSMERVK